VHCETKKEKKEPIECPPWMLGARSQQSAQQLSFGATLYFFF
jgi:hypothetical protein